MADSTGAGRDRSAGSPFRREGLASRGVPFAVVAVVAELSLALPPGPVSATATVVSAALLAATFGAVFLPWDRLPDWAAVGVPLLYTGSVLALLLAAGGPRSGISVVLLIPLTWTALFHRPWESAWVLVAIVAALAVGSLVPGGEPVDFSIRRLVFWAALGAMIAIAAHGLRARIRRSQQATTRVQERLRELSIIQDRDRIASNLQDTVVQRMFAAGLTLQGIGPVPSRPEVGERIAGVVHNLDEAIKLLRESIFGLEHGLPEAGLRRGVLDLCSEFTPLLGSTPEVILDGPLDDAIPSRVAAPLLGTLREGLTHSGTGAQATRVSVAVSAGPGQVSLTITDNGIRWPARAGADSPGLAGSREAARRLGGKLELSTSPAGQATLTWQVPLPGPENGQPATGRPPARPA